MKKICACIIFFFSLTMFLSASPVVVKKQAEMSNPKLLYKGITGDSVFNKYILSNLQKCGWFDVVTSGNAKYEISGTVSNEVLNVEVSGASTFRLSEKLSGNKQIDSYRIADEVLNKIFGISGICYSKIAFVAQKGKIKEVMVSNFDGSDLKQITRSGTLSLGPKWGPGNKTLIYTSFYKNYMDVLAYSFASGKVMQLSKFPGMNTGVISPNGKYIALILSKDKQVDLYLKRLSDGKLIRVTNDEAVEGTPCWSPNSNEICFVSDKNYKTPRLFICNLSNKKTIYLNSARGESVDPSWSPDGKKIVYSIKVAGKYTIAVYDIAGDKTEYVPNLNKGSDWLTPSWSPDNRHVVCSRRSGFKNELYVVDTWLGNTRALFNSSMDLSSPDWSYLAK